MSEWRVSFRLKPEARRFESDPDATRLDFTRLASWLPPSAFARSASADRRSLGGGWLGGRTSWYTNADNRRFATMAGSRFLIVPAAALRGFMNTGSPSASRSRFMRSNDARGR